MSRFHRTVTEHREAIEHLLAPLAAQLDARPERVSIGDVSAHGRVLTRQVEAFVPVPAFDNSQMDGFAVLASDLADASPGHPVELPLGHTTAAGDAPNTHVPGTASPVMTGAAIPVGADAVVPVEATVAGEFPRLVRASEGSPSGAATFTSVVDQGTFVRRRAEDLDVGATVLAVGTRLTASRIGAAAAVGSQHVEVRPRLRVLLCSTGDELAGVGRNDGSSSDLGPGQICDANTPMLQAALDEHGAVVTVLSTGDDADTLRAAILERLPEVDLVITTGGISRGAYEVVRDALDPLGITFGSVAMQPGGPQGMGQLVAGDAVVPVLCFPGNPVSALLSFVMFLAPTLHELVGRGGAPGVMHLKLAHDAVSPENKHQIRRGVIGNDGRVTVTGAGSHLIGDLAAADVLVHLPVGVAEAAEGTEVDTWRFND